MNIPDAAVEAADAAIEALWLSDQDFDANMARAAIEAAMPAIREALAQEVTQLRRENESLRIDLATCERLAREAAIARAGTTDDDYDPNGRTNEWY